MVPLGKTCGNRQGFRGWKGLKNRAVFTSKKPSYEEGDVLKEMIKNAKKYNLRGQGMAPVGSLGGAWLCHARPELPYRAGRWGKQLLGGKYFLGNQTCRVTSITGTGKTERKHAWMSSSAVGGESNWRKRNWNPRRVRKKAFGRKSKRSRHTSRER